MSKNEKLALKIMVAVIMILIILTLLNFNTYLFTPITGFFKAIFLPFIVTGVLFYLLRPLVNWLEDKKLPRAIAVLLIYLVIGSLLFTAIMTLGPTIQNQFVSFFDNMPKMVSSISNWLESVRNQQSAIPRFIQDALPNWNEEFKTFLEQSSGSIMDNIVNTISGISSAVFALFLVPFVLYYTLKDGRQLKPKLKEAAPSSYRKYLPDLLKELDQTIGAYILGQATVSLCVGILLFIGYSIIGLDYSLVLALTGLLLNVVPFLGPIIATIPALIVGLFQEPLMALYVIIVAVVTQQIEGNLISPQVMGHRLDIHPLTVITLLLVAGTIAGILGIIFVVPAYAIAKVFVLHAIKLYRIHKEHSAQD